LAFVQQDHEAGQMAEPMQDIQGAVARRYRLEREIGRGGMAVVYLAHDLKHDRAVAIKVLRRDLARAIGAERFLREIRIAARLSHPNILPLHDSDQVDDLLFYVMPFVDGESLRQRLARDRVLDQSEALGIAREIADALSHAHAQGIVHRDVKPENIMLAKGHALLTDFGIARALDPTDTRITETGLIVGTPAYMSPEQIDGADCDGRTDIYSLGCVTFEMLTGRPPYSAASPLAILAAHARDAIPDLRESRSDIPESVARALTASLAKNPAERCASAAAFATSLRQTGDRATSARSIAVLPFVNIGGDPEDEFFADGMTEDVIAQLSRIRSLKVISRTSVMAFKGRAETPMQIARQLGVSTLLEGSVRRSAQRIRIVAQLIEAATDRHLWAETYDRELTDAFAIQTDVAMRIASALEAELSPQERADLRERQAHPPDTRAYESYLRGRFHFYQHNPAALSRALQYFEQALAIEPDYALAHGAIADAWGARTNLGLVPPRVAYPNVRAGVLRALELNDRIAETHDWLGRLRLWYEWDWRGAETAFRRAIDINSNYPDARMMYSLLLASQQRFTEAAHEGERACSLDPLNPFLLWARALVPLFEGRDDVAREQLDAILRAEPAFLPARLALWTVLERRGEFAPAIANLTRFFEILGAEPLAALLGAPGAGTLTADDYSARLRSVAGILVANFENHFVPPSLIARMYVGSGDAPSALHWLERAFDMRDFEVIFLAVQPAWRDLGTEPRFQALRRRLA
jgi:serine/threonine-protein kinase